MIPIPRLMRRRHISERRSLNSAKKTIITEYLMGESSTNNSSLEETNELKEESRTLKSSSTNEGGDANDDVLQKTRKENDNLRKQVKILEEEIASLQKQLRDKSNSNDNEVKHDHPEKTQQNGWIPGGFSLPNLFEKNYNKKSSVKFQALSDIELQAVDDANVFVISDDDDDDNKVDIEKDLNSAKNSSTNSNPQKIEFSSLVESEQKKDSELWLDVEADLEASPKATYINQTFWQQFKDRCSWLVGLLILQSCSSFILKRNEELLESHLDIYNFLTMLVGAGGNAGNQACVRVIRELALGTLNGRNQKPFLITEFKMGVCLSIVLAISGLGRALFFGVSIAETIAITTALWTIVCISVAIGALLPLLMKHVGIDPAHSSTTIQVVMDILGVTITVVVSSIILSRFNNE